MLNRRWISFRRALLVVMNLTLGARAETPPEAHVPSPRPCQLADVPNVSGGGLPTQPATYASRENAEAGGLMS